VGILFCGGGGGGGGGWLFLLLYSFKPLCLRVCVGTATVLDTAQERLGPLCCLLASLQLALLLL
jgi:hypothetical protein